MESCFAIHQATGTLATLKSQVCEFVQVAKYWRRAVDLEVSRIRPEVISDDFETRFPRITALDVINLGPCIARALEGKATEKKKAKHNPSLSQPTAASRDHQCNHKFPGRSISC